MTTPGPWHWQRPISRDLSNTLMGDGRIVLRCIDISQKNAAIVAAAPDLLEALQALCSSPLHSVAARTELWTEARAAIARATSKD
jgi:hypothetical protein